VALRDLEVPQHRAGFDAQLMARLEQAEPVRGPTVHRPRSYLLTGLAAAVAIIVGTTVLSSRDEGGSSHQPQLISASFVRSRVAGALASLDTLQGEIDVECANSTGVCSPPDSGGRTTKRWTFKTTAAGDERVTGIGFADDLAVNAEERVAREVTDYGRGRNGTETINLPPGPPDGGERSPLRRALGSVVRAFVTDSSDVPVTDTTEQGRKAWRIDAPITPNKLAGPGNSADRLEVIVDQRSGFPLRVTESFEGRFLSEVRLSKLVTDQPIDRSVFTLAFPPGAKVFKSDAGFQTVTLKQAATIVGYQPFLPTQLPEGFVRAEITAAQHGPSTGNEGANPPADGVVSVAYRRGFDRIIVTTRLRGSAAPCSGDGTGATACWADPVGSGEGVFDTPSPFNIETGGLSGSRGELVLSLRGTPHAWAIDDRYIVTVSGDASPAELRQLMRALEPTRE
jgi:hypothetical protein